MNIQIVGPKDKHLSKYKVINTTTSAIGWSRGLSPMLLGPVNLYGRLRSENAENAWQYSKVYKDQVDASGFPSLNWYSWRNAGLNSHWANRYPKGKGAIPLYSYWDGRRLSYVDARKEIYIPLYSEAVQKTDAFKRLLEESASGPVTLFDYDGYDHEALGMSLTDVINCETKKMGHAFVLKLCLQNIKEP